MGDLTLALLRQKVNLANWLIMSSRIVNFPVGWSHVWMHGKWIDVREARSCYLFRLARKALMRYVIVKKCCLLWNQYASHHKRNGAAISMAQLLLPLAKNEPLWAPAWHFRQPPPFLFWHKSMNSSTIPRAKRCYPTCKETLTEINGLAPQFWGDWCPVCHYTAPVFTLAETKSSALQH